MSKNRESVKDQKYWIAQNWKKLEENYQKFLQENSRANSFNSGELFISKHVNPIEYELYGVKDIRAFIIKLTNFEPPLMY